MYAIFDQNMVPKLTDHGWTDGLTQSLKITKSILNWKYPTTDPEVASSIPARSNTFEKIDHETISSAILILPLVQEADTSESMTVLKELVNYLVKLAQEKSL